MKYFAVDLSKNLWKRRKKRKKNKKREREKQKKKEKAYATVTALKWNRSYFHIM